MAKKNNRSSRTGKLLPDSLPDFGSLPDGYFERIEEVERRKEVIQLLNELGRPRELSELKSIEDILWDIAAYESE